ncbi:MAG TPA: MMPL family transporter [Dehalococcoidia bacterium]|nr:MMPL family transporter [Dehalococcoidia bacterium]
MLDSLGAWVVRARWWVIAFWVAVLLASLPFAPRATSALRSGFGDSDTESRQALRLMAERLDIPETSVTLVFSSDDLTVADARYARAVERATAPLTQIPAVERIVTYHNTLDENMVSPDGRTTYAFVSLDINIDSAVELVSEIRSGLQQSELDVWVTGGIAIFADLNEASEHDLRRAEIITLPVLLIALLIVFKGVFAAGLPLAMGGLSIVVTLALVYALAQFTDMSIFVLNIASFLGLGMAVDYSLLMVSRYREELERREVADAVRVTMATAGKAIVFSAGTSMIGLSGLLLFKFMMLRSLGVGGITVIFFSLLIALTLIPALLAVLGGNINALSIVPHGVESGRFWRRLSRWVMRHPVAVAVPVTVGLLLLGAPFLNVRLGSPWASILPEESEARVGWDLVAEEFGAGELAQVIAVTTSPTSALSPENVGAAYDFVERVKADPRVARVDSIVSPEMNVDREQLQFLYASPSPETLGGPLIARALDELVSDDRTANLIRIVPRGAPVSDDARALVEDIRASPPGGDLTTYLTGATPDLQDTVDRMYSDFPKIVVYVAVVTYVALFLLFRSVLLPLKAVVLNVMSILASFGALVFVFQQGHFQSILGFTSEGFIEASVPILLFSIVFGLSMDYEVFLLSRVKEEYEANGDNADAVAIGMERSGRIITSAALVLILVSAGFASGDILIVKALGFGTALAIFIDSTIVRALLVPALMRLFSAANWWAPAFLGGGIKPGVGTGGPRAQV